MILNPTGPTGTSMHLLAQLVAGASAFQEACAVATVEDAERFTFYPHYSGEDIGSKPAAVVTLTDGGFEYYRVAGGASNQFLMRGQMLLQLLRPVDDQADSRLEELSFLNYVDEITRHLRTQSGKSDNLNIVGIEMVTAPARSDPRNVAGLGAQPPFYHVGLLVDWDSQ